MSLMSILGGLYLPYSKKISFDVAYLSSIEAQREREERKKKWYSPYSLKEGNKATHHA